MALGSSSRCVGSVVMLRTASAGPSIFTTLLLSPTRNHAVLRVFTFKHRAGLPIFNCCGAVRGLGTAAQDNSHGVIHHICTLQCWP